MLISALTERLAEVQGRIAAAAARGGRNQAVVLVAVTKTLGPEAVRAAFDAGIVDVGENQVQEAIAKMAAVSVPVNWHLIGHLQRNKVKHVGAFRLVHSLDSVRLAHALNGFAEQRGEAVDVLLQVNASRERSKGGFEPDEIAREAENLLALAGIRVRGVMTMAALDAGEAELRQTFAAAREVRGVLAGAGHPAVELSMGMSQDYEVAVEEGATIVRLGTTLFGPREER
jgi:pyridoxal phosphate enzyme (YggS family)